MTGTNLNVRRASVTTSHSVHVLFGVYLPSSTFSTRVQMSHALPSQSLSSPPTSPLGFVLIPLPVFLLSLLLNPVHAEPYVGHGDAFAVPPLSLLCSKFTPSCSHPRCQFLPCWVVGVCGAGCNSRRLGGAPSSRRHHKSPGASSSCCFFTVERVLSLLQTRGPRALTLAEDLAGFSWSSEKVELNDACFSTLEVIQE